MGRRLSKEGVAVVKQQCVKTDVQICVSDGLSSTAINANIENIMPILTEGLKEKGLTVGTPFFVKYGGVGIFGGKKLPSLSGQRLSAFLSVSVRDSEAPRV